MVQPHLGVIVFLTLWILAALIGVMLLIYDTIKSRNEITVFEGGFFMLLLFCGPVALLAYGLIYGDDRILWSGKKNLKKR